LIIDSEKRKGSGKMKWEKVEIEISPFSYKNPPITSNNIPRTIFLLLLPLKPDEHEK
jgi:hypothetical protein